MGAIIRTPDDDVYVPEQDIDEELLYKEFRIVETATNYYVERIISVVYFKNFFYSALNIPSYRKEWFELGENGKLANRPASFPYLDHQRLPVKYFHTLSSATDFIRSLQNPKPKDNTFPKYHYV